nr:hypothetical protein [Tanacetum cinerariifolium]
DCPIHRRLWVLKVPMTRNLKLLINFVEKFLETVKFGNDQIVPILGYGDLAQGTVTIKRVYYVEGLNHNLFSRNDLLTGSRGMDLYSITLQDTNSLNLILLMAKATSSQAWLWHRRLSYLNFDTINLLSKNDIVVGLPKLKFVKDHLCSSYTLQAQVRVVQTDKGAEFLNHTLHAYFAAEGILHQTSVARTPEQNGFTMTLNHDSLSPAGQRQANVPLADMTVSTSNELDLLFSLMFNELLNGSFKVVSKSFAVSAADAPNQQQVIGNPLQSVRTRRQLESDAEMCMFALTVSRTEPKNIKEAMSDAAWIESMQEKLHQFD